MKKSEKEYQEQKELREQQEAAILRRVLIWLCVTVILEAYVLLTNRFLFHYRVGEIDMIPKLTHVYEISQLVFLGLCVVFAIWAVWAAKKTPGHGVIRSITAGMFGVAAVCSFLFVRTGPSSITVLQVAIPVMGVLILIYYLYQKEFFSISVLCALGILGLWMFRAGRMQYTAIYFSYLAAALVIVAVCAVLMMVFRKNNGTLTIGKKTFSPFLKEANYSLVLLTCALVAALLVIPLVAGAMFAYYAIFALIIWVFVMAVYFTAKLM